MCILLHHFKTRRLEIKTQTLFKKKFWAQLLWDSHRLAGAKKSLLSWTMDDFAMHAAKSLSHALLFKTLWAVVGQAPLSMGFSRQEHWSGLPCPPPRDLPNLGIELKVFLYFLHRQAGSLPLATTRKPFPAYCKNWQRPASQLCFLKIIIIIIIIKEGISKTN